MRAVLVIARGDLVRRVRNRSALITAVVAPLALSVVFSLVVGGPGGSARFDIGVVAATGGLPGEIATGLVEADATPVRFVRVDSSTTAARRVDDGELDAALVIPTGIEEAIGGRAVTLEVLRNPDQVVSGGIAESVATDIAQRLDRVARVLSVAGEAGADVDGSTMAAAMELESAVAVVAGRSAGRDLTPAAFFGASMSMLFLFFTVGFASESVLVERRQGTLDRLLSTPTSAATVLAGKAVSVAVLGLVGFCVVWGVTSVGFGARWGWWPAVLVLIVATTVAVAGVATFAASLARTEQQTQTVTAAVAFTLALLGGNFVGPGQSPELLGTLSRLTPNGWALGAFADLATDTATVTGTLRALVVLVGFGVALGAVGAARIHRVVQR